MHLTILQEVPYHTLVVEVVEVFLTILVVEALHVEQVEPEELVEDHRQEIVQVVLMGLLTEVVAEVEPVEMVPVE